VPPRYAICPSREVDLLPAPAQALLRGKEHNYPTPAQALLRGQEHNYPHECFEVTTEEARALEDILNDAGLKKVDDTAFVVPNAQGDRPLDLVQAALPGWALAARVQGVSPSSPSRRRAREPAPHGEPVV
jgi:hypothetical protein